MTAAPQLKGRPGISHRQGIVRDAEIARIGQQFGWVWIEDERRRTPMPVRMLDRLGFHEAAHELAKDPEYPR